MAKRASPERKFIFLYPSTAEAPYRTLGTAAADDMKQLLSHSIAIHKAGKDLLPDFKSPAHEYVEANTDWFVFDRFGNQVNVTTAKFMPVFGNQRILFVSNELPTAERREELFALLIKEKQATEEDSQQKAPEPKEPPKEKLDPLPAATSYVTTRELHWNTQTKQWETFYQARYVGTAKQHISRLLSSVGEEDKTEDESVDEEAQLTESKEPKDDAMQVEEKKDNNADEPKAEVKEEVKEEKQEEKADFEMEGAPTAASPLPVPVDETKRTRGKKLKDEPIPVLDDDLDDPKQSNSKKRKRDKLAHNWVPADPKMGELTDIDQLVTTVLERPHRGQGGFRGRNLISIGSFIQLYDHASAAWEGVKVPGNGAEAYGEICPESVLALLGKASYPINPTSLFIDVGSGRGGIVCQAAAMFGCRAVGIEIEQYLHDAAEGFKARMMDWLAEKQRPMGQVDFICADAADRDLWVKILDGHTGSVFVFMNNFCYPQRMMSALENIFAELLPDRSEILMCKAITTLKMHLARRNFNGLYAMLDYPCRQLLLFPGGASWAHNRVKFYLYTINRAQASMPFEEVDARYKTEMLERESAIKGKDLPRAKKMKLAKAHKEAIAKLVDPTLKGAKLVKAQKWAEATVAAAQTTGEAGRLAREKKLADKAAGRLPKKRKKYKKRADKLLKPL